MTPVTRARFDGYSILITAAGQGIGAATAHRLAAEGASVLVTDLDAKRASDTAAAIREAGGTADSLPCDVADRTAVEAAVAYAVETFGGLDVLVNNAYAAGQDEPLFEDETDATWERDLNITLSGPFRCARAALPHLVASGRGAIVTIGSVNGEQDFGGHAYSAAKAGLTSLTRTLAGHAARAAYGSTWWPPARFVRRPGRAETRNWNEPLRSTHSAGSAPPRTSRRPSPSWPPPTRRGSRGRRCGWTAGSSR